jgi:Flp pilus assembly protein TadD
LEIKIDPKNPELYSGLAATYVKLGDKDNAIKAANKVLEIEPSAQDDVAKFKESLK